MEVTPNYSYVFNFENEFIHQDTRVWMVKNWTWVFYYCGVYMLVIFGGQHLMQNRPRWVLTNISFIYLYDEHFAPSSRNTTQILQLTIVDDKICFYLIRIFLFIVSIWPWLNVQTKFSRWTYRVCEVVISLSASLFASRAAEKIKKKMDWSLRFGRVRILIWRID